jgi:hypothetical protein
VTVRTPLVIAALALVTLGGCKQGRQKRTSDAAPVEIVTAPIVADAGTASATDEIEPNDGEDVATALGIGGTVRGRIETETDADHYKIDVSEPGALSVELTGVDGVDLVLEILDTTGTVIAKSDRGAAKVREGVPNVGVTPGRYLAVVRSKKIVVPAKKGKPPKKGKAAVAAAAAPVDAPVAPTLAPVYEISAKQAPVATAGEREPDDDRGTAIDLIVGDTVTGFVGWSGDADVWKLSVETLSEKNAIDVEVSAVEGTALSVEIADGVGQPLALRKGPRGQGLVLRGLVPVVPPGAPPYHYVTIRGDKSNPETAYQLRVTANVPKTDAELEPNDTLERAMAVAADRTEVHGSWTPGDIDCFVLAADAAPRTIDVTVDTPPESDLEVELLVDGKVIAKGEHPGKGAAERVSGPVPAGAQPVIRIRGTDTSGEGAYDIKLGEGPAPSP